MPAPGRTLPDDMRNQHVQAELFALVAHQIGDAGLADAELFDCFGLGSVLGGNGFPDVRHQLGTHRENCCLGG